MHALIRLGKSRKVANLIYPVRWMNNRNACLGSERGLRLTHWVCMHAGCVPVDTPHGVCISYVLYFCMYFKADMYIPTKVMCGTRCVLCMLGILLEHCR